MTAKTHKAGGMLVSIVGFAILKEKGLLLSNVSEGLQWLVMYPMVMWGSTASDLDHHWDSCPTKDYPSKIINMALHITKPVKKSMDRTLSNREKSTSLLYRSCVLLDAKHRSWQTHSDLFLFFLLWLQHQVFMGQINCLGGVDKAILTLVLTGLCMGILAHFVLDMLTPDGIWMIGLVLLNKILKVINPRKKLPEKLHLVPKSSFFATGGAWEDFIYKVLKVLTAIAVVWFLFSLIPLDIFPYQLSFN